MHTLMPCLITIMRSLQVYFHPEIKWLLHEYGRLGQFLRTLETSGLKRNLKYAHQVTLRDIFIGN